MQGNLKKRSNDRAAAGGIKLKKQRCMMAAPGFSASIGGSVVSHQNTVPNDGTHGIHVSTSARMEPKDFYAAPSMGYPSPSPSPYSRNTPSPGSLSQMRSQSCFSFRRSPSDYRMCVPQQDSDRPQPPASINGGGFSEKLSRKEIQQPFPSEKQKEMKNLIALQQAKQKLMEQQMAHDPDASFHPTVTPLKLLTPDPMMESPPQHIPPRRKRLTLTYAPPPQYASVIVPPRLATMNGVAAPFIPTKDQFQPQRSQVAMPFDPLAFDRRTARNLRSQRAVSSPFCMLPTSASSSYPRSNVPMTSIESRGPMTPFIEPSNSATDDLLFDE